MGKQSDHYACASVMSVCKVRGMGLIFFGQSSQKITFLFLFNSQIQPTPTLAPKFDPFSTSSAPTQANTAPRSDNIDPS